MNIEYLIEKYSKLVYKICFNMLTSPQDAEDATQDTYLNFYKSKERYENLSENELKNVICKIALNRCKDILKSKLKKLEKATDDDIISLENYEDDNDIEEYIIQNEESNYISKIINDLKEPYSSIINYYYIDGMSLDEVSTKLEIPKTTLKMQIYRAKKILKEKIIIDKGGDLLERK